MSMMLAPYSKTRIERIRTCAWLAHAVYVLKYKFPVGRAAITGIGAHAVFADTIADYLGRKTDYGDNFEAENGALTEEMINLGEKAVENLPLSIDDITGIEQWIRVDKNGILHSGDGNPWFVGITDIIAKDKDHVTVLDLKTGRSHIDSILERHAYIFLARALYPSYKKFMFGRYYVRDLKTDWYEYEFGQSLVINGGDERRRPNYLLTYLTDIICRVRSKRPRTGAGSPL
jgi:hypothetical protein